MNNHDAIPVDGQAASVERQHPGIKDGDFIVIARRWSIRVHQAIKITMLIRLTHTGTRC